LGLSPGRSTIGKCEDFNGANRRAPCGLGTRVMAITAAGGAARYAPAMSTDGIAARLLRRAVTIGTPLACVGVGLWLAYLGWSWPFALAATAAAASLALLIARVLSQTSR